MSILMFYVNADYFSKLDPLDSGWLSEAIMSHLNNLPIEHAHINTHSVLAYDL